MSIEATSPSEAMESAKRRQILDGARAVFLAQGFDAASMGEIARVAGVSKGTLYVYFDSKERLFEEIVHGQCRSQAEQVFALDSEDHDVEAVLTRLGKGFVRFLCRPDGVSPLRTVISIADRMRRSVRRFMRLAPLSALPELPVILRIKSRPAYSPLRIASLPLLNS